MPYKDPKAQVEHSRQYHRLHRAEILEKMRVRYQQHREQRREKARQWRLAHPEWYLRHNKEYYARNVEYHRARALKWASENRERRRTTRKKWRLTNLKQRRTYEREYVQKRIVADPNFAMRNRLRCRLYALLGKKRLKMSTSLELVGCSMEELRKHLEARFVENMSWENRRLWEIDHKRPCSSFDLTDPEQQKACFHYTNLQPLWRARNRSKGGKWSEAA